MTSIRDIVTLNSAMSAGPLMDRIEQLLGGLGKLTLATMGVIVGLQILFRFVPVSFPSVWTTEVARYLLVFMTLTGVPYAMRRENHISVRPLLRMVSDSIRNLMITLSNVLVVVMCSIVVLSGFTILERTMLQSLPTVGWLKVGYLMIYLIAVFGLCIVFIFEQTARIWTGEATEPDVRVVNDD
ncbi:TRAP transporter small permease subunit [Haloterrigena salinisoli]|uniref:TRAP transporter small permease n=1 Tax=Haloterrigena salinisoli TaxID=3132747 RepID=UPI0030CD4692